MYKLILNLAVCLFLFSGCQETTQQKENKKIADIVQLDFNEKVEAIDSMLMGFYKKGKLNGNVIVVKGGKELYHKSFGYADSTKINLLKTDYQFGIGSIYKEFPAVSIMQLREKGKISLDDKIGQYLSGLADWSNDVSIKNLLQYTSGLPRIDFNKYFSKILPIGDDAIMEDLKSIKKLEFTPGSDYIYSNLNPFLLIKIIEKVTAQKFEDYVQVELLSPLKMNGTQIKDQYPYVDRGQMANPVDSEFKEDQYNMISSSMLFTSTVKDLSIWISNLNSFQVIGKESMRILAQTAKLTNENMQAPLGNCIMSKDEIVEHTHHGSMGNYEGLVQRFNQDDLTIVILTNQKNKNVFEFSEMIVSIVNK